MLLLVTISSKQSSPIVLAINVWEIDLNYFETRWALLSSSTLCGMR